MALGVTRIRQFEIQYQKILGGARPFPRLQVLDRPLMTGRKFWPLSNKILRTYTDRSMSYATVLNLTFTAVIQITRSLADAERPCNCCVDQFWANVIIWPWHCSNSAFQTIFRGHYGPFSTPTIGVARGCSGCTCTFRAEKKNWA